MAIVSLLTRFLLVPLGLRRRGARTLKNCSVLDRNVCTVIVIICLVGNVLCLLYKTVDKVGVSFFSRVIPPPCLVVHHWLDAFFKIFIAYCLRYRCTLLIGCDAIERVTGEGGAIN